MIAQGHPELTLKKSSKEAKAEPKKNFQYENVPKTSQDQPKTNIDPTQLELTMRGNQDTKDFIQQKINQAIQMERDGNIDDAIDLYKETLLLTTPAMNGLAWLYATERNDKLSIAENLSNLSIQLSPNEANYWDTYAEILFRNKQYNDALFAKKKAAELDPSFNEGMEKYEKN